MPKQQTNGICLFCKVTFSKKDILKHIHSCDKREAKPKTQAEKANKSKGKLFHILIEGLTANQFLPEYWMHIEMPSSSKLKVLDDFLRNTWLECCGHMSAFRINEQGYSVSPMDEFDEQDMDIPLNSVLKPKTVFFYEYDFGTTTELKLTVLSEREANNFKGKAIKTLAISELPIIKCEECKEVATMVCSSCIYEGKGWVCEECAEEHECGEEMLLPVVNSPRVGMCAYEG